MPEFLFFYLSLSRNPGLYSGADWISNIYE